MMDVLEGRKMKRKRKRQRDISGKRENSEWKEGDRKMKREGVRGIAEEGKRGRESKREREREMAEEGERKRGKRDKEKEGKKRRCISGISQHKQGGKITISLFSIYISFIMIIIIYNYFSS